MSKPRRDPFGRDKDEIMECWTCRHWTKCTDLCGRCTANGGQTSTRHTCALWTRKPRPVGRPRKGASHA